MKKILTVYTGGTICSVANGKMRSLSPKEAPKVLPAVFSQSSSPYAASADLLFEDSAFPEEKMLLSENMTPLAWQTLLDHLGKFSLEDYAGVILLHGTDTLAYTAGLLSFWFAQTPVPFMLVAGNRPPSDPQSNAHANFRTAVELILQDISPNVYVPYRNCDGTLWLHAGARLTQCPECSEDFLPIGAQRISLDENGTALLPALPAQKVVTAWPALSPCKPLSSAGVLVVHPYTGLDYTHIDLHNIHVVLHGTYHSGTVCALNNASPYSVFPFAERCRQKGIPLFVAPCVLNEEQYASAHGLFANSSAIPLPMTLPAAYGKVLTALACGIPREELTAFMRHGVNGELLG